MVAVTVPMVEAALKPSTTLSLYHFPCSGVLNVTHLSTVLLGSGAADDVSAPDVADGDADGGGCSAVRAAHALSSTPTADAPDNERN